MIPFLTVNYIFLLCDINAQEYVWADNLLIDTWQIYKVRLCTYVLKLRTHGSPTQALSLIWQDWTYFYYYAKCKVDMIVLPLPIASGQPRLVTPLAVCQYNVWCPSVMVTSLVIAFSSSNSHLVFCFLSTFFFFFGHNRSKLYVADFS